MSGLGIPVDMEKSEISSNLNAFILFDFLTGMYTIIYFGTIYLYITKNPTKRLLIPATLTVLYLSKLFENSVQWYAINWQYVKNGDSRDSVFISMFESPQWLSIVGNIAQYTVFVLADGLLIWRCFFVWNRSLRVMALPFVFMVAETGLFFIEIIIRFIFNNGTTPAALVVRFNDLLSAAYFMSFATTILTTTLIAYKIHSVLKEEGVSARRFIHIVDIVVQSGAIYAFSSLVNAIAQICPGAGDVFNTRATAFSFYASGINVAISGISATIMVARVAMHSADTTYTSTSIRLSGLQFNPHSAQRTESSEGLNVTRSSAVGRLPVGEGEVIEEKV